MFETLQTFDTEFSADSVEWCPIEGFKDLFVCGTYQLSPEEEQSVEEKTPQKRVGRIFLFQIIPIGQLKLLQKVDVPAVLDMKWAHVSIEGNILLGVANSIGYIQVYKLLTNEIEGKPEIQLLVEKKIRESSSDIKLETLALSLDWSTGKSSNNNVGEAKITVSDSDGIITIFNISSKGELSEIASVKGHDFQAWISAFDYWNTDIIYSGGDDCKFKWYDFRTNHKLIGTNKIHEAGVTSLHSNSGEEFLLASGSYDEALRLWDTRSLRQPISKKNLDGGIWRLKWDPFYHKYLFAACMYGGFKIVDCQNHANCSIINEYNEHESIAYGCDWSSLPYDDVGMKLSEENCQKIFMATCSFYDHKLKLSSFCLKE